MDLSRPIVVGVDGSDHAVVAVRWAARQAAATGAQMQLVHAVNPLRAAMPTVPIATVIPSASANQQADAAQAIVTAAADIAHAEAEGVTTLVATQLGDAAHVLVEASAEAALVIVGSRGLGGVVGLLLGSVSAHVATHARCPAVVVHGDGRPSDGPIVVGVDGSAASEAALRFAVAEAARHRLPVVAVHAWALPPAPPGFGEALATLAESADDTAGPPKDAMGTLSRTVAPWRAAFPDVDIREQVATGDAADALLDAAREAALVVVGSRGHGALRGVLLGSTSQKVLRDARCPVAVTPIDQTTQASPPP